MIRNQICVSKHVVYGTKAHISVRFGPGERFPFNGDVNIGHLDSGRIEAFVTEVPSA